MSNAYLSLFVVWTVFDVEDGDESLIASLHPLMKLYKTPSRSLFGCTSQPSDAAVMKRVQSRVGLAELDEIVEKSEETQIHF